MPQATEERELIRAQARYVHSSARKARLVLEHIRGKSAVEAQSILAFQTRAVARDAGKVLRSAIANAENNNGHDAEDLVVVTAWADEGPTLKRWRARARGRVNRIRKRTCHITITVSPAMPGEIKPRPVRRARPEVETAPAVAEPAKPKRSRKKAAPDAAAAAEPESAVVEPEPEPAVEPEAAAESESEPETAVEAEAAVEPEAVAEPESEPETAVEAEAAVEPEAAAEPEPEPEEDKEPAADETSPDSVENEKEADS
ncbi:MAG: large subunit ribosomal protein [Gaiellales bacterium]|nr:large subunit ribosomal protein [Gaiellales bacterium]